MHSVRVHNDSVRRVIRINCFVRGNDVFTLSCQSRCYMFIIVYFRHPLYKYQYNGINIYRLGLRYYSPPTYHNKYTAEHLNDILDVPKYGTESIL